MTMSVLSCGVVGMVAAFVHVLSCVFVTWDKHPGTFVLNKQPLSCHAAGVVSMDKQLPLQNCIAPGCPIFIGTCSQFFSHFLSPICLLRASAPHYFKHSFLTSLLPTGTQTWIIFLLLVLKTAPLPLGATSGNTETQSWAQGWLSLLGWKRSCWPYRERGNPSTEKPLGKEAQTAAVFRDGSLK